MNLEDASMFFPVVVEKEFVPYCPRVFLGIVSEWKIRGHQGSCEMSKNGDFFLELVGFSADSSNQPANPQPMLAA